jgi:hypothetical protein
MPKDVWFYSKVTWKFLMALTWRYASIYEIQRVKNVQLLRCSF